MIGVSALNVFKPYVADTFLPSMAVLLCILIVDLVVLIIVSRYDASSPLPRWMTAVGIVMIVSVITGNIFALFAGDFDPSPNSQAGQTGNQFLE